MSTTENLNEIVSAEPITIQPSGMAFSGVGDSLAAGGNESSPDALGAMALLHAVRRHFLVILSTGLACGAVTGLALWAVQKPQYKAEAMLELKQTSPKILSVTADQQTGPNEFEVFRDTQMSFLTSRFVITAALRDPKLKNRPCILEQDAKHNTIQWLMNEIHIEFPPNARNASTMKVTATETDREDAAAIVNAVVDAYMTEVVNFDRDQRRIRLSELQQIAAEKEIEVRTKREQLKRELESFGAGDDETMKARGLLAVQTYAQFLGELQRMRAENRQLLGKLKEQKKVLQDLPSAEIPQSDVVLLLNNNPTYRDLTQRHTMLDAIKRAHDNASAGGTKPPGQFADFGGLRELQGPTR